jgi:L-alanine-DL-glutamate epimerase-like enolase superfamily enzyme
MRRGAHDRRRFLQTSALGMAAIPGLPAVNLPKMKIKTATPLLIRGTRNYPGWIFIRIGTDQGIEGIGEGFSWGWANLPRVKGNLWRAAVDSCAVTRHKSARHREF